MAPEQQQVQNARPSDADDSPQVINLWTGPRSLSTSLMYSFAERDDTEVLDEPLYPHYLRATGADRPYKEELLSRMETDGNKVVDSIFGPCKKKYRFCKQMAKHRTPDLNNDILLKGKHVILIRDPLYSLPSFADVINASLSELQWSPIVSIYCELHTLGKNPPVVDASDLQNDPEGILRALCDALDMDFQPSMLKWEAGPKEVDGIWAPWWYSSVHKTSGFLPRPPYPKKPFPMELYSLLEACRPFYTMLKRHAIKRTISPPRLPVAANENIFMWVGDELVPRHDAKVSVFDSIVQGGDGVWEGLRIYKGKVFKLDEHLNRLYDSAKAMAFSMVPCRHFVKQALFSTLLINGMFDNAHVRLTLTRGLKVTSSMNPAFNLYGCTLLVVAEWKPPVYDNNGGIRLVTASTRRNSPNCLDSKIHHNNLINNILAKIEGNRGGAEDAIMLDCDGFVSETNATNLFMVKKGTVLTPHADYCLPGITRSTVIDLVKKEGIPLTERRISLTEFHTADEVWTTGTMGELTPVLEIDGRQIGDDGNAGPITRRVQAAYKTLTENQGERIPFNTSK